MHTNWELHHRLFRNQYPSQNLKNHSSYTVTSMIIDFSYDNYIEVIITLYVSVSNVIIIINLLMNL